MRTIASVVLGLTFAAGCSAPASTPSASSTAQATVAPAAPAESAATPTPATSAVGAPVAASPASASAPPVVSAPDAPRAATPPAASIAPSPPGAAAPAPAAPPAPTFREVTIPSGTTLAVELRTTVASNTSAVEDRVQGVLRRPIVVDGEEIVPAGAEVSGVVTEALPSARVKGRARLALRFNSITVDDAPTTIGTAAIARMAPATKKNDAGKIAAGAGAGAIIGAIAGGKKGAVVGTVVGGGAGTGVVLATRGDEVTLAAGTSLTTTLTRPLVVQVPVR